MPAALGVFFAAFLALGLPDGMLGVAWPHLRADLRQPVDALGAIFVGVTAAYLVTSSATGALMARYTVARLLAGAVLSMALGMAAFALAPAWPVVLLGALLWGAGAGVVDAGINTHVALRRGAGAMNVLHGCYGVGATLGPVLVTAALAAGGWRLAYGTAALLLLVLAGALGRVSAGRSPAVGGADAPETSGPTLRPALARGATWLGIATFFVYTGVEVGAGQWAYTVLVDARGAPEAGAALTVSLFWGLFTAGRFLYGVAATRALPGRLLASGATLCLLGALVLAASPGLAGSAVGLAVLGLGLAPIFPLLVAATPGRVGTGLAPRVIGLQVAAATAGGAVLPALLGVAGARLGLAWIPTLLVGLTVLVALLCGLSLRARTGAPR